MKFTRVLASAACALALNLAVTPAQAQSITNGSFEADSFTGSGTGYRLGLTGNDVTGWYIPSSDGIYPWGLQNTNAFAGGPADTGNQWLVLGEVGSLHDYTIQQTISGLTPGESYTLAFALASELGSTGAVGELSWLSGSSTAAQDFTAPATTSTYWDTWGHYSETFVATDTSATFQMKDLAVEHPGGDDLGLDSFSILSRSAVPEPATWAMMLIGFGGIGFAMRRHNSATPQLA